MIIMMLLNVDKTKDIPMDYNGVMGVPIHLWINTILTNLKLLGQITEDKREDSELYSEHRHIENR